MQTAILRLTVMAALLAGGSTLHAGYQVTDLGVGFSRSGATHVNNADQVVGFAEFGTFDFHTLVWQGTTIQQDLGGLSVLSLNNSGQMSGAMPVGFVSHAFLRSGGVTTDLGTLGGNYSTGEFINSSGQVAGNSLLAGDIYNHAFLYSGGVMTDLGADGELISSATGLNDAGEVSGINYSTGVFDVRPFIYSGGVMTTLGTLGGSFANSIGINNDGEVAGNSYTGGDLQFHAYLYTGGTMVDLGTLGGVYSSAADLNDAGEVVGESYITGNVASHAFLYSGGTMIDLGTLGGSYGAATLVNNMGTVVGASTIAGDSEIHFFVYRDGQMLDLTEIVRNAGWTDIVRLDDINDFGTIVGTGLLDGQEHALRLDFIGTSSVPEPSTVALLALGTLITAGRRLKRKSRVGSTRGFNRW